MLLRRVSELTSRPVAWLWPGRLPLGRVVMFEGDPGLGKSLVTLDLCARLSTGRPFPDGQPGPGPASAIILNAEDNPDDTIRPRLEALGADLASLFILDPEPLDAAEPLRLPSQVGFLDGALGRTGARLVILDPITAFLDPGVHPNNDQSVRRTLLPLARLADKHQCVILLVRHLNKSGSKQATYRGSGAISFISACRSGWLFARDPHDPRRCILAEIKNNLAPPQPSLVCTISTQEGAPPTVTWAGTSPLTADQVLAASGHGPLPDWPRSRAGDFLERFLRDGPRTSREVWEAAQEEGHAERTLIRAKEDLDIRSQRVYTPDQRLSYWLLPDQKLPATAAPDQAEPDLEEWLAPLREKYPPLTPLDDL
jgi:putative DNA primase/helicase